VVSPVAVGITIALLVAALIGMTLSWRRRGRRQRGLTLPAMPQAVGAPVASAAGLYLATTFAGKPLERVVAGGLGFRARASVTATETGVLVERRGSADLFVPADRLLGSGSATWTIDRAVEPEGLTVLAWRLGDGDEAVDVESSFRLDGPGRPELERALTALVAPHPPVPTTLEVPRDDD
jgi:hypothetical protein